MRAASDRLGRFDYNCLKGNPCFIRRPLLGALLAGLILFFFPLLKIKAAPEEAIDPSLDEHVIYVMGDPAHPAMLQVTTFYPDGSGPYPLAVINHSKAVGDSKNEPRYRSIFLSRYFLSRGYAVALPMMRGFAGSGGVFHFNRCDLEGLGLIAAADILEVIKVLSQQPHIDGSRVIVIGAGLGGWNMLVTGTKSFPGIKGLLIFSAGVRERDCPRWEENLVTAAGDYGARSGLPSLWFCGQDDEVVPAPIQRDMYQRYTEAGGKAELVAYGSFKWADHNIAGSQEGFPIWYRRSMRS